MFKFNKKPNVKDQLFNIYAKLTTIAEKISKKYEINKTNTILHSKEEQAKGMIGTNDLLNSFNALIKEQNQLLNKFLDKADKRDTDLYDKVTLMQDSYNSMETNIYTKDQTTDKINEEIDYRIDLDKFCSDIENRRMYDFVKDITSLYSNLDKYMLLDVAKQYTRDYVVIPKSEMKDTDKPSGKRFKNQEDS